MAMVLRRRDSRTTRGTVDEESAFALPTWGSGLVALIDESADEEVYRIGAVVVEATAAPALEVDLDTVMQRAASRFGLDPRTELHGQPLLQGSGPWRRIPPHERSAIYRSAMRAVAPHVRAILFRWASRAEFRKKRRYPGSSEHEVLMQLVLGDLSEMGRRQGREVCVVADDVHVARSVVSTLEAARDGELPLIGGVTPRWIGTIGFHDSARLRQVQAADLVTYMRHRMASGRGDSRAARVYRQIWNEVGTFVLVDHQLFH